MNQNINKSEQNGRSMVEMLGVLAVIGILSVGGVVGYKFAMEKHKLNNVMDGLYRRAIALSQRAVLGQTVSLEALEQFDDDAFDDYSVEVITDTGFDDEFGLKISGLSKRMCQLVVGIDWNLSQEVTGDTACNKETGNSLSFAFANDISASVSGSSTSGSTGTGSSTGGNTGTGSFTPSPISGNNSGMRSCTTLNAKQCYDITVETCEKSSFYDGFYWSQTEVCEYGCTNGKCNTQECSGNERRCWGETAILICENGKWKEGYKNSKNENVRFKECLWGCENNACIEECNGTSKGCIIEKIDGKDYLVVLTCSDGIWDYAKTGIRGLACEKTDSMTCEKCIKGK